MKDRFYKQNEKDIKTYKRAAAMIEKLSGERRISKGKWQNDIEKLEKEKLKLQAELDGLKEDYGMIQHIKYAVNHVNDEYGIDLTLEIAKR